MRKILFVAGLALAGCAEVPQDPHQQAFDSCMSGTDRSAATIRACTDMAWPERAQSTADTTDATTEEE